MNIKDVIEKREDLESDLEELRVLRGWRESSYTVQGYSRNDRYIIDASVLDKVLEEEEQRLETEISALSKVIEAANKAIENFLYEGGVWQK